jgi:hypothetical protein
MPISVHRLIDSSMTLSVVAGSTGGQEIWRNWSSERGLAK